MIPELVKMYEEGAITAHHLAVQCLHVLDPAEPDLVLAQLPDDILAAIQDFAEGYDPKGMKTNYGVIPAQDQVIAATKWIREANANLAPSQR
ncbi:MAG: hypothetical protein NTY19_30720 [Planctomycetota bacterium]|nr:hypothetical protein [Planctomycetota bacterium]